MQSSERSLDRWVGAAFTGLLCGVLCATILTRNEEFLGLLKWVVASIGLGTLAALWAVVLASRHGFLAMLTMAAVAIGVSVIATFQHVDFSASVLAVAVYFLVTLTAEGVLLLARVKSYPTPAASIPLALAASFGIGYMSSDLRIASSAEIELRSLALAPSQELHHRARQYIVVHRPHVLLAMALSDDPAERIVAAHVIKTSRSESLLSIIQSLGTTENDRRQPAERFLNEISQDS